MQLQLKHLPILFLVMAGVCLAGAYTASTKAPVEVAADAVTVSD